MKRNVTTFLSCIALVIVLFGQMNPVHAQKVDPKSISGIIARNAALVGFSDIDLQNYRVSDAYVDKASGATIAYLQQTFKGADVFNAIKTIAIKNDKIYSVAGSYITDINSAINVKDGKAKITAADAVKAAAAHFSLPAPASLSALKTVGNQSEFGKSNISTINIKSRLLWLHDDITNKAPLVWQVEIQPVGRKDYWLVNVDAEKGIVVNKMSLTNSCDWNHPVNAAEPVDNTVSISNATSPFAEGLLADTSNLPEGGAYRVIPYPAESPIHPDGKPAFRYNPWKLSGENNPAVTFKWYSDTTGLYDSSRSNNVLSQEDVNGNDGFGMGAHSFYPAPHLLFNHTPDFTQDPTWTRNQQFAITNLFYWNNILHDVSYQYGFDEASGNFQNSNLDRGGRGRDYVFADAQDGSGTNNANFGTPSDGSNPRMQMFLWDASPSFTILKPKEISGKKEAVESAFSSNNKLADKGPVTGSVVLVNDDSTMTTHLGCGPLFNPSSLVGKIALIDRGSCNFTVKVKNAQDAGAIAAIVVNNVPGSPIIMGGEDNTIVIPAVMVSLETGDTMKYYLALDSMVTVTMSGGVRLDGDLDNGIIAHEYTHGISNRLTGGPNNVSCLFNAEEAGEGWSDYLALMVTTNWKKTSVNDGTDRRPIGTYVLGQTPEGSGIRTYPYSTDMSINPWTYADMTASGGEVHVIGEIWCTAVWEMTWAVIDQVGTIDSNLFNESSMAGNNIAMQLVMEGMKLQPCRPGFIDARNGILAADTLLYGGKYSPAIWKAFAKRGMGVFAQQGSSNSTSDQVADFTVPAPLMPVTKANAKQSAASVTALGTNQISIMPNPAKDFINVTVKGNTKPLTITLLGSNGQKVATYTMSNQSKQISLPALSSGIYYVNIIGEGVSSKNRIVIQ